MKPLKSQVSFSKDRNFTFRRKTDSFREKRDEEGERNKDKDKCRGKDKDKDKKAGDGHQITSALASSLAATLSPFSSFVSSHSPRGSRKPSPSPTRRSSPPSPRVLLPVPRTNSFSHRSLPHPQHPKGRTNSFNFPSSRFSSGSPRPSSSPSPSPSASSPSLSPTTSRSDSSSSVSDNNTDEDGLLPPKLPLTGCRPKIRVSSEDDDVLGTTSGDEGGEEKAGEEEGKKKKEEEEPPRPRVLPYRIEEGWETHHSTDTVAKHR